jgi:hypothetical protein
MRPARNSATISSVLEIDIFNPSKAKRECFLTRYFKGFTPAPPQNPGFIG